MINLNLSSIIVTHNDLRKKSSLRDMVDFVRKDGIWRPKYLAEYALERGIPVSPLIQIVRFEDGQLFLHDGHHRAVACLLGGRDHLYPDEYRLADWKYEQYLEINLSKGWYTPFDPRTHTRTPDFSNFKGIIRTKLAEQVPQETIIDWILTNSGLYKTERKIQYLPELAELVSHYEGQMAS